jgi:ribonuclease BN (tRNA processing enzyme)/energy-coupling factor transporter ATP-binding protein EcfA2
MRRDKRGAGDDGPQEPDMTLHCHAHLPVLPCSAEPIIGGFIARDRRVLLFGPPGIGKSTLAAALGDALNAAGRSCRCLSADPGSPAFGPPGALSLGLRNVSDWQPLALEPLCTLDAGRFRLPLVGAMNRLLRHVPDGTLLIDAPGVARGVAGRELLQALVSTAGVDLVLALTAADRAPPLIDELAALQVQLALIHAADAAQRPGRRARAFVRTVRWDSYLGAGPSQELDIGRLPILGTPPPLDEPGAWTGRQTALLRAGETITMAEVLALDQGRLSLRAPADCNGADALVVRDAVRGADGLLESAAPFAPAPAAFLPPTPRRPAAASFGGPRPALKIGGVDALLVNGIFGDPLLHVRLRNHRRSLLFDLGGGWGGDARLSAHVAHQVTDCFITHAHMDHLSAFVWLLRSRIGELPPCRLFGPTGLAGHIRGLVDGFLWDRIGGNGPAFEITELHGETLHRYFVQAGMKNNGGPEIASAPDGTLRDEPGFRVRAVVLDHHTPVLAYAFEPAPELNVRKDRLRAAGLSPGPWLNALKAGLRRGTLDQRLQLPNGRTAAVGELGRELVLETPGKRLVYATDLADSIDNRARLVALARNAHTLFLEATFAQTDAARAAAHAHLTGRACGEIAEAAGVSRLVPFHLSRRYALDPADLFDEIRSACGRALLPER